MFDPEDVYRVSRYRQHNQTNHLIRREQQLLEEQNRLLRKAEHRKIREENLPKCPWCGTGVHQGYEICRNCKQDILWIGNRHGKPEDRAEIQRMHDEDVRKENDRREREYQKERASEEALALKQQRAVRRRQYVVDCIVGVICYPITRWRSIQSNSYAVASRLEWPLLAVLLSQILIVFAVVGLVASFWSPIGLLEICIVLSGFAISTILIAAKSGGTHGEGRISIRGLVHDFCFLVFAIVLLGVIKQYFGG